MVALCNVRRITISGQRSSYKENAQMDHSNNNWWQISSKEVQHTIILILLAKKIITCLPFKIWIMKGFIYYIYIYIISYIIYYINVSLADFVSFCFYSATVIHSGTEEKRRKRRKNHRHHHCNKPFLFSAAVTIPVHYRNLRLRLLKIHGNLFKQTNLKAEDVTIMHPNNSLATHNNLTSKWRLAPPLTPTCCRPQNRFWNWLLYHEQWPHFAGNEELSIDLSFSVSSQGRQGGTDISLWLAYQGKVWIIMS